MASGTLVLTHLRILGRRRTGASAPLGTLRAWVGVLSPDTHWQTADRARPPRGGHTACGRGRRLGSEPAGRWVLYLSDVRMPLPPGVLAEGSG